MHRGGGDAPPPNCKAVFKNEYIKSLDSYPEVSDLYWGVVRFEQHLYILHMLLPHWAGLRQLICRLLGSIFKLHASTYVSNRGFCVIP